MPRKGPGSTPTPSAGRVRVQGARPRLLTERGLRGPGSIPTPSADGPRDVSRHRGAAAAPEPGAVPPRRRHLLPVVRVLPAQRVGQPLHAVPRPAWRRRVVQSPGCLRVAESYSRSGRWALTSGQPENGRAARSDTADATSPSGRPPSNGSGRRRHTSCALSSTLRSQLAQRIRSSWPATRTARSGSSTGTTRSPRTCLRGAGRARFFTTRAATRRSRRRPDLRADAVHPAARTSLPRRPVDRPRKLRYNRLRYSGVEQSGSSSGS